MLSSGASRLSAMALDTLTINACFFSSLRPSMMLMIAIGMDLVLNVKTDTAEVLHVETHIGTRHQPLGRSCGTGHDNGTGLQGLARLSGQTRSGDQSA